MQKCACGAYVIIPDRYVICTVCRQRVFAESNGRNDYSGVRTLDRW